MTIRSYMSCPQAERRLTEERRAALERETLRHKAIAEAEGRMLEARRRSISLVPLLLVAAPSLAGPSPLSVPASSTRFAALFY